MLVAGKKIAIIGGGPVGLLAARLLQEKGALVQVFERDVDRNVRIGGGTLDIHHDHGQIALKEAGLLTYFIKSARGVGMRSFDINGHLEHEDIITKENKFDRPEIDRKVLRDLLVNSLKSGTVLWDKKFQSLFTMDGKHSLYFKDDPATYTADLIIGADGSWSKVRPFVTDVKPTYTGTTIVQGNISSTVALSKRCDHMNDMVRGGNVMMMGEQKMLFIQARGDNSLIYYLSFKTQENWKEKAPFDVKNLEETALFLKYEMCKNWHSNVHELFAASDEFGVLPMYRQHIEKVTDWNEKRNIVLVGDAAHVMPPFAGIGVNVGLLDALRLTQLLTEEKSAQKFKTISAALQKYNEDMVTRAYKAQQDTAEAEEGIHSACSKHSTDQNNFNKA